MDLVSLRLWHWIIIGLVFGALIGYAYTGAPANPPRSGDLGQFQMLVRLSTERDAGGKVQRLRNIKVYEPETDPEHVLCYPVTYEVVAADAKGNAVYQTSYLAAKTPFVGQDSIKEFLSKNKVSYADRSGNGQYIPVAYGAIGGVLVIGFFWPMVISLLVTAGFVPERVIEQKPEKAQKASAGSHEDKSIVKAGSRAMTGGDLRNLNSLNDDMQSKLASGLKPGDARTVPMAAEEPVSVLMSGNGSRSTSDPTAAAVVQGEPEKPKDYKGEWYPVARPIVKKDVDA